MDFSFLTGCASQFWHITSGVCRAVAACLGDARRPATLPRDLVLEVHRRVTRVRNRLLALMARVQAGRQVGGWSRAVPASTEPAQPRTRAHQAVALPRRFGWLVHLVGYQAAGHGSQLAHLLADPEMLALLRDVPQARRILAPLCRMLGVAVEGPACVRRRPVRAVAAPAEQAALPPPAAVTRIGYVASARWPRGVIARGSGRLKPV